MVNQLQLTAMTLQQYESTFYSYFDIYIQVKDRIVNASKGHSLHTVIMKLKKAIKQDDLLGKTSKEAYNYGVEQYCKLFVTSRSDISHYFRTLYRLLTIADSCPLSNRRFNAKMKYVKIIRSQLSDEELLLIYYNCHSAYAGKSKRLVTEYNLLKHLSPIHKFEIINRFNIPSDILVRIENFYDFVSPYIIQFVNQVCESPEEKFEDEYDVRYMNCIFKMEYDEDIIFSIVCRRNNVSSEKLTQMFSYLLYDQLFISQFELGNKNINTANLKDSSTGYEIYTYTIKAEDIKKITIDKNEYIK